MIKKIYQKPTTKVVILQRQPHLLSMSNVTTSGADGLNYDDDGGNQEFAW